MDTARALKAVRKLRKLLKAFSAASRPEDVHALRTRTRRLEAGLHALPVTGARKLLKTLKPMRQAAGRVRDMDVLVANVSAMTRGQSESAVRLIEEISARRAEEMKELCRVIRKRRRKARKELKRCEQRLTELAGESEASSLAPMEALADKLKNWPALHSDNLHDFRKAVKELRYMLQLVPGQAHDALPAMERVKNAAGAWHDWAELESLARKVLDADHDKELLRQVHARVGEQFRQAMGDARRLRRRDIELSDAA